MSSYKAVFIKIFFIALFALGSAASAGTQENIGSPIKEFQSNAIESMPIKQALAEIEILQKNGHLHDALYYLNKLVKKHKDQLSPRQQALLYTSLGNSLASAGKTKAARNSLNLAIKAANSNDDKALQAVVLLSSGNLYAKQQRYIQALDDYDASLFRAKEINNTPLTMKAYVNNARIQALAGDEKPALALISEAQAFIATMSTSRDKAYGLINLATSYEHLARRYPRQAGALHQSGAALLEQAVDITAKTNDIYAQSYAVGHSAANARSLGQKEKALALYQRAAFLAQQAKAPEILFKWEWRAGQLLREQGQMKDAISSYRRAVHNLQLVRDDMPLGTGNSSFRDVIGPVYFELADILLTHTKQTGNNEQLQEYLVEARNTIETLKTAELQDYFQDDCVTALQSKVTGLDKAAANTAIFYPIILEDRVELLLSLENGIRQHTINIDRDTITEEVNKFRTKLEDYSSHEYLQHAQQLYKWLIAPVEAELKSHTVDTLVVVPDGPLRTIPMAALHDGKQFLAGKIALAVTPGLTLTDPRPLARDDMKILVNGLTKAVQGFSALPSVDRELQEISRVYDGTVLKDEGYLAKSLQEQLSKVPYRAVHIASHGQFKSDPKQTFLLTYDEKLTMDKLEEYLQSSKFRDEPVELLTLSACQTAAGDDRSALGLAGMAVKAGARSVLASLWRISDDATAVLIPEFYRQLQDRANTKAEALRQAQLSLIKSSDYNHPGFWAPFLMIGNWM